MSAAHFVLLVLGLAGLLLLYNGWRLLVASGGIRPGFGPVIALLAVLVAWYLGLTLAGMLAVRKSANDAFEGRFAEADGRLRRLADREPWMRLLGASGAIWAHARTVEAYVRYLSGVPDEALRLSLEGARDLRPAIAGNAAIVAASTAAELGRGDVFAAFARHLARAKRRPGRPRPHALLGAEGLHQVLQLRLDEADARADLLIAADPGDRYRIGRTVKAAVALARGDLAAAESWYGEARRGPGLAPGKPGSVLFGQLLDAALAEIRRLRGDAAGAAALAREIAAAGPRHRTAALSAIFHPALHAASRDGGAEARTALERLDELQASHPADPALHARVALARARLLRALGDHAAAAEALAPAVASPLAAIRQEALLERGICRRDAGDPAGAQESWTWCLELGTNTRCGLEATALLETAGRTDADVPALRSEETP